MISNVVFSVPSLEAAFNEHENSDTWLTQVLDADNNNNMWLEGEQILDHYAFNQCLIPKSQGGQWAGLDDLMDLFRVVYRRDPCLGLGYAGSSFIASCNILAVGSVEQKKRVAKLLKDNEKLSCSYYEPSHGNDLSAVEFSALPSDDGDHLWLNGSKQVTSNMKRSAAFVAFTRTSSQMGSASHSQILVFKDDLPEGALKYLTRHPSVGMRGVQLGGFSLEKCAMDNDIILGVKGKALDTVLRSFQVTRTLLPGMFCGVLDTALRIAMNFTYNRKLYGKNLSTFPTARYVLVQAYLDLLLSDSLSRIGARALHILPEHCCLYAPAIKILVPKLLIGAMNALADHLGSSFYHKDGEYKLFQKLLRDVKPAGFAHVGRPACQLTLMPLLYVMSKKAPLENVVIPESLTDIDGCLDELDFDKLRVRPRARDPLLENLDNHLHILDEPTADLILDTKEKLNTALREADPQDLSPSASEEYYNLSTIYSGLLSISSCIHWHVSNEKKMPLTLLKAIVKRQLIHLNLLPEDLWGEEEVFEIFQDLENRYQDGVSFDLKAYKLKGNIVE